MVTNNIAAITIDSSPGSPLRRATRLLGPSAAVRIAARLHRSKLDRALSDGADPAESPLIAARAVQLAGSATRARIADGLESLARSAEAPPGRVRVLPPRAAMLANRSELLGLAELLRRDRPLYARGVAALEVLVTDGTGPAYTDRRGDVLARRLQVARAELTG
jgi:hypothetical protein